MLRSVIYQMKRQYGGGPLDIYKFHGSKVDLCSGDTVVDKELIRIKRAVILPARVERTFVQNISKISADKQFVYGGTYDRSRRMFLIDHHDIECPNMESCDNFELQEDDWIVYCGDKYEIKHFDFFEEHQIFVVIGHRVHGDVPEQIIPVQAFDRTRIREVTDGQ